MFSMWIGCNFTILVLPGWMAWPWFMLSQWWWMEQEWAWINWTTWPCSWIEWRTRTVRSWSALRWFTPSAGSKPLSLKRHITRRWRVVRWWPVHDCWAPQRYSLHIDRTQTCHHCSFLVKWHGREATGNALAEVSHAVWGKPPDVISNRDTVDPLILQHTLHHLRKHSRVLIVSSVSYLSALSVKDDRDIFIRSFSSKVGHF